MNDVAVSQPDGASPAGGTPGVNDAAVSQPDGAFATCDQNNGGCDPRVTCQVVSHAPVCGPCPLGYAGNGHDGCKRYFGAQLGLGAPGYEDVKMYGVGSDPAGNVFVVASTTGKVGAASYGADDVVLVKLDTAGAPVWVRQFGSSGSDDPYAVVVDDSGNAYVTGATSGDIDGSGRTGSTDAFVAKFDSGGTMQWLHRINATAYAYPAAASVDPSGGILVAGWGYGTFEDPGDGTLDGFLAKYDPGGTKLWSRTVSLPVSSEILTTGSLAVDKDGNSYVGVEATAFVADPPPQTLFVSQIDPQGLDKWTQTITAPGGVWGGQIAVDGAGGVYVGGSAKGAPHLGDDGDAGLGRDAGAGDTSVPFVAKLDTTGSRLWLRQLPASLGFTQILGAPTGVYSGGSTTSVVPGGSGAGSDDLSVARFDASGSIVWAAQFGTQKSDTGGYIASAPGGGVYLGGNTRGAIDDLKNPGGIDFFVMRYDGSGERGVLSKSGVHPPADSGTAL